MLIGMQRTIPDFGQNWEVNSRVETDPIPSPPSESEETDDGNEGEGSS